MRKLLAILLTTLCLPLAVGAEVIQVNPNSAFDADIHGVSVSTPAGGSATWVASDLSGNPGSGALLLQGPAGHYLLWTCLRPDLVLPFGRHVFDFSVRAQGSAAAHVAVESVFALGGDDPVHDGPCDGPWTAYLRYNGQAAVVAPARIASSIPTYAFPLLSVSIQLDKTDAGPLFIDDWSVSVDTDVIFREDDTPVSLFTI